MTFCQECARPWGVILERGEVPTDEGLAAARVGLIAELRDYWEIDEEPELLERVDWDALPLVKAVEVVYITEAFAGFCCDHNFGDGFADPPYWTELEWLDLPAWLLKGRKRRWSYRWDCCDIGFARNFLKPAAPLGC